MARFISKTDLVELFGDEETSIQFLIDEGLLNTWLTQQIGTNLRDVQAPSPAACAARSGYSERRHPS